MTAEGAPSILIRAPIAHTPGDPFTDPAGLETFEDGGLAFAGGRIVAIGDYREVRCAHPAAETIDARDAILLPGFVDSHVHFPQLAIIGALGLELLDWLRLRALPEEARLADPALAAELARTFLDALARNGTTTALVFGAHFAPAQEALFTAAARSGLRIASGLVVSDRELLPGLETDPDTAFADSAALIARWHGRGRLRYAITPRFAVSCSEAMLEVCGALQAQAEGLLVTTHLNEHPAEIARVGELFPHAADYLSVYEQHGLVHAGTVLAHDVHPREDELRRLAGARASVAHCPSSNAFLGSGSFPLARHRAHGVRVALGSDVGAGTSLSLLSEALAAYQTQMVRPDGEPLDAGRLLYLATRAGALALGCAEETGDLRPGKSADLVLVRPPAGSTAAAVLARRGPLPDALGTVLTLAREEAIAEVRVGGERVPPPELPAARPGR